MAISYDPNKLPEPANGTQQFLIAILVELRAIRIALQEQNKRNIDLSAVSTSSIPVVTKATRK